MRVEQVIGYDGDGRPCEVFFIDGVEVSDLTWYELDPDDGLLRRGRGAEWLEERYAEASSASPAAAELIRRWARQTAEHGGLVGDDEDEGEGADADVDDAPSEQQNRHEKEARHGRVDP